MILNANKFTLSEDGTYVAEISELQRRTVPVRFILEHCEDGFDRTFKFSHTDESGGDIAGWHYAEENATGKPRKVLIIND